MMQCFHFIVEPAKNITAKLKESRRRAELEKRAPLEEEQLFVVELARDLARVCRNTQVLEHIWNLDDTWPRPLCRAFILEWASMLESKKRPMQTDGWPEKKGQEEEEDEEKEENQDQDQALMLSQAMNALLTWVKDLRAQPEQSVWPGEAVSRALEDLQSAWKWNRTANLQAAMELVMMVLLSQGLDKEGIPQKWLIWKQRTQKIGATRYIPHSVWNWISEASVDVTLDLNTANPDLLISPNEKRMRCGFERQDAPNHHGRFDGWWCAVAQAGFASGRHYWEVEVGERDWRLGVAEEAALRKGFKSLNTDSGYLTLRLERGTELKALTVPFTALPPGLIPPRRVGVHLDYAQGQLSFYDAEARAHIYTYNRRFAGKLFPLFGTVEIVRDLVIRPPEGNRPSCLCPAVCLWA